jgi:hypothetical protein
MNKQILAQLIEQCLTNKKLDNKKVEKIAQQLTRTQLKAYIDGLKRFVSKNTVVVESAGKLSAATREEFVKLFKDKDVVFRHNPELIVGTRIIDNDIIYELNLKDTLQHMKQYVTQE